MINSNLTLNDVVNSELYRSLDRYFEKSIYQLDVSYDKLIVIKDVGGTFFVFKFECFVIDTVISTVLDTSEDYNEDEETLREYRELRTYLLPFFRSFKVRDLLNGV